jgi:NADH:ubiquinone oxidoreductase subunit 5 (subunit L)/multisubunit Na+/H+ antiporter MnhA subunit
MSSAPIHPAATHHLPSFITAPGETDVLMVVMAITLAVLVLAFGVLFLRLHTLPERIAHKSHKLQFEIVAVLGLIALFTHMHIFWVAGLLLALMDFPDLGGWLNRIAGGVETIACTQSGAKAHRSVDGATKAKNADDATLVPGVSAAGLRCPEYISTIRTDRTPAKDENLVDA